MIQPTGLAELPCSNNVTERVIAADYDDSPCTEALNV